MRLEIQAGWATREITPPLGLPMGGRGPRFSPATEVLDPLLAQVTVLEDDAGQRAVFVSVDLIELSMPHSGQVIQGIAAALGVAPEAVLVNASHTHSGPMMGFYRYATLKSIPPELEAYFQQLPQGLIRLALEAEAALEPVQVFWRQGTSRIAINRRRRGEGGITMGPNPQGRVDEDLWMLEIRSRQAPDRRALLFAHGCHPVMVYDFAWQAISAEWPGEARRALQRDLGTQTHTQFFQGLAGNVRPRVLADMQSGQFRAATPQDVREVGETIAADLFALIRQEQPPMARAVEKQAVHLEYFEMKDERKEELS